MGRGRQRGASPGLGFVTISSLRPCRRGSPAGAKLLGRGFVEELLEVGEAAEVLGDLRGDIAFGIAAALGLHDLQNMVWLTWPPPLLRTTPRTSSGMLARSETSSSGVFLRVRVLFDRAVEVGDVGLVVLVVVKLHGRFVDGGLESGVIVGKGRKFEGHGGYSFIVLGFRRCARSSGYAPGQ